MIEANLPVLIVVLPLILGVLTAMVGHKGLGWWLAMGTTAAVMVMSGWLLTEVLASADGVLVYELGNWPPPFGIEYRIDALNGLVLMLVAGISVVTTFYARRSVASEIAPEKLRGFYGAWLLCITGLLGITITGDAFNLYVLLELSSLATYTLVAMGKDRDRRALSAAINYLVLGTIGASFILLGIGYLYMVTGTLNMADMGVRLQEIYATWGTPEPLYKKATITGFAFLMVGLSIKLALFPLHGWMPNAYAYAPSAVSALLASTTTKVGAYTAIRFLFTIMGVNFSLKGGLPTQSFLMVAGSAAILFGSYYAIRQNNLKRLLAYSSIAQIGYITLGIALANEAGLTGAIIHLFNHAITKGGLFLVIGIVVYRLGSAQIQDMRGLGRRMPVSMALFFLGGLGLIGVPLTSGFISKWYLVTGALDAGRPEIAIVLLVGSVLACVYVWRVIEVIYFQPPSDEAKKVKEAPLSLLLPAMLLIGASIYFGIDASQTTWWAEQAVRALGVG